jgi:hypothetical protein
MKSLTFAGIALFVALAASCDSVTGSDDDNFTFTSSALSFDSSMVDEATVGTQLRNLQIDGVFLLPHPCFELIGAYRRTGGEILFTASAYATDANCPAQASAMQYRVSTFGMTRGTYRVTVYHNIAGTAPKVVTQTTVTTN